MRTSSAISKRFPAGVSASKITSCQRARHAPPVLGFCAGPRDLRSGGTFMTNHDERDRTNGNDEPNPLQRACGLSTPSDCAVLGYYSCRSIAFPSRLAFRDDAEKPLTRRIL